jgi:predicted KAP-like P-loop ATPase
MDRLGRTAFAQHLSDAIASWNEPESLVIAICGEWGIGKSSLKNLVLEQLRSRGKSVPDIVQFNPWQWTGHEGLTSAFFREVLAVLTGKRDKNTKPVARSLRRYAAYLGVVNTLLAGSKRLLALGLAVVGTLSIAPSLLLSNENAARFAQVMGAAVLLVAAIIAFGQNVLEKIAVWKELSGPGARSLEDYREEVAAALKRYEKAILVVIDDIDRLTDVEIQAVFQLIKANADFPRFVYLVMFQRSIVEAALKRLTSDRGKDFLEKIVQVSFDVPPARQDEVEQLLSEGLERILGPRASATISQGTYWGNVYVGALRPYFQTLRSVKRFLGSLEFHMNLLRTNGTLNVNPVDLIAVETIRLFEPALYRKMRDSKGLLTSARGDAADRKRIAEDIKALVSTASAERLDAATELIRKLFPPAAFAFGDAMYSSSRSEEWKRELRVCAADVFDRYFQLGLSKGEVPQSEVEHVLAVSGDYRALTDTLERLDSDGKLVAMLNQLDSNKTKIEPNNAVAALTALFDVGERLPESQPGTFYLGPEWTICRIAYWVLKAEPEGERTDKLEAILKATIGLRIPTMFIGINTNPQERQSTTADIIIPDSAVGKMQRIVVEKIKGAAAEGQLLGRYDLAYLLFRWRDWDSEAEPRQWASSVSGGSPANALALLRAFLHKGTSQTIGDNVARTTYFMKYSELENFVNLEKVEQQINGLLEAKLSEDDRRVVKEFRKATARKCAGKKEGDFGWEREDD